MISTSDSSSGRRENRNTVKVWIPLLVAAVLAVSGLYGDMRPARGQSATVRADAIGHAQLDMQQSYLDGTEQSLITNPVSQGTGLLNFDNVLAQRASVNVPVFSNSTLVSIHPTDWITTEQLLQYHYIVTDQSGNILPWYAPDNLGASYDHILHLVFEWWLNIARNPNEPNLPFYLMHRVWKPAPDYYASGIGGDQLAMAMSSWSLFYSYTGDQRVIDNMILMANHVLANGLSAATDSWPDIPFSYNYTTLDKYDGDLILGPGYTQPDKAGSFGYELLNLYKITGDSQYLQAAIKIANTLASKTQDGDANDSPLPFRVRTLDGSLGPQGIPYTYTTNFTGLLMLWEGLSDLGQGHVQDYQTAHTKMLNWLKTYPVHNNKWGPFFEDVGGWSDTQINAVTLAMYIMEHPQLWGATWQQDARAALDWPIQELGNNDWIDYGVQVMNEQTAYRAPGNSHTSRQASMELRYAELTGDTTHVQNAIRQLSWATYMVDFDGKNYYPGNDIWLTDGYGDYVRHYMRAMAAAPSLAPGDQDHLLSTSSVIQDISYQTGRISYQTFDDRAQELVRISTFVPLKVTADGVELPRLNSISELDQQEGYTLGAPGDLPSVLRIRHDHARTIVVTGDFISASKSVALARTPVQPGDQITYTIAVRNGGPADAVGVHITDTLPSQVTGANVDVTRTITAGDAITITMPVTLSTNAPWGAAITNTAYYWHSTGSGSAHAAFTIAGPPQLGIAKSITLASPVQLGQPVTYAITLSNTSPSTNAGVVMTDSLPTALTFGGWVQRSGATQAHSTIVWTGDISAHTRLVVAFTATLASDPILYGQIITNTAYFQSANATSGLASTAFTVPAPDLSHSVKLVSASTVKAGELVTYTILLSNTGSLSTTVHYTDTLPTELEWLNGDLNGAVTVDAGKSVTRLILAQAKTDVGDSAVFYNTVDIDDVHHSILTRRSPPTAVSAFRIYLPLTMYSQISIGSGATQAGTKTQTTWSCIHRF